MKSDPRPSPSSTETLYPHIATSCQLGTADLWLFVTYSTVRAISAPAPVSARTAPPSQRHSRREGSGMIKCKLNVGDLDLMLRTCESPSPPFALHCREGKLTICAALSKSPGGYIIHMRAYSVRTTSADALLCSSDPLPTPKDPSAYRLCQWRLRPTWAHHEPALDTDSLQVIGRSSPRAELPCCWSAAPAFDSWLRTTDSQQLLRAAAQY
ncbi:hypothetical protein V8E36_001442 [Tilletia maclaganii]